MIIFRSIQRNTFIVVLGAILWPTCVIGETQVTDARAAWEAGKIEQAVTLWTTLAAEGDASAQYETGRLYQHGAGVSKNLSTATHWYRKAAEQDHTKAQTALA